MKTKLSNWFPEECGYEGMREGRLNGLPFQLQAFSSETATCNIPIFLAWAIKNQWYHCYLLSVSILWGRRDMTYQNSVSPHKTPQFPGPLMGKILCYRLLGW